jgi:hypothetical protein
VNITHTVENTDVYRVLWRRKNTYGPWRVQTSQGNRNGLFFTLTRAKLSRGQFNEWCETRIQKLEIEYYDYAFAELAWEDVND